MIPNLKAEILDPELCKGAPSQSDFGKPDALAAAITEKHKEMNLSDEAIQILAPQEFIFKHWDSG